MVKIHKSIVYCSAVPVARAHADAKLSGIAGIAGIAGISGIIDVGSRAFGCVAPRTFGKPHASYAACPATCDKGHGQTSR